MKRILPLALSLALTALAHAAPGPLRVLFAGKGDDASGKKCHALMRDLGREAIWFDYVADKAGLTPEWLAKCDVVLLDAPSGDFPALAGFDAKRVVTAEGDVAAEPMKAKLLAAAGDARRKEYEAFLAQREPEKREPNPNVANYEKRPEPLTFQHPFSVKGSMERTQVPADMRLVLFAAEPDIMKPIAFAWDERGRLWVCETRDYPHGVSPDGEGHDDIKICEDTDGDGKADKFTVFADKLNIPTSITFARGGVIVSQPPRLLFLKDTNGDDKADVREDLITGWGIGDTHAQASNLHYGYDNWIYGCVGYSGFKGTVGGKAMQFAQGTYRFRPDGSALEFLHQFSNNSWAQSFNAAGDDFGGTANGAPIFYGGIPATIVPPGMRAMTAKKINTVDTAHTITPNYRQVDVMGGYTSAAGSSFIYSANLPPRLQGRAMVCEPTMKIIQLMDVQPSGAGYVAKDGFNIVASSDEWMSPVFAEVGPDGAVWFADWQNFIIQHNPTPSVERGGYKAETGVGGAHKNDLRDHARGRIYRVVWSGAKPPVALADAKSTRHGTLLAGLSGDTQYGRLQAQRFIVEEKVEVAAPVLSAMVKANDGKVGAIHALWSLEGLSKIDEPTHKAALLAKDPALRRNAIRALGSDAEAQALLFGSGVISDPDPVTRLAAMVKLATFPTTPEIKTLVGQLSTDPVVKADEWLAEAARIVAKKHGTQVFKEGPNLLPNPSLETLAADGLPEGWTRRDYGSRPGNESAEWKVVTGAGNVHSGTNALRCITRDEADTSFFAEVKLKPNTEYKLSGWVKAHGIRGKISLNDHVSRNETDRVTKESDWVEIETTWNSGDRTTASINLLHVAKGDGFWDDLKLVELLPADEAPVLAGDAKRGEEIFWKHPVAACLNCHMLGGKGSTVGPALDGIAGRFDAAYLAQSLTEPGKVLAKGYEALGTSPMPPMGLILKPQELEDVKAFLQTLKK